MDYHTPVLLTEVINIFNVCPGKIYIDCTLGNGGHTVEILKRGGTVYGLDTDPTNLETTTKRIQELGLSAKFHPIHDNFKNIIPVIQNQINTSIDGLLIDLGLSSNQQTASNRGFSFNDAFSLDMRLDPSTQTLTAEEIINTYSYQQLFDIFSRLAQEKLSKLLVPQIIIARQKKPIREGTTLAKIVSDLYQKKGIRSHINPATKIFMALRIVVNQEIENLKQILSDTTSCQYLKNCTVCIISFHSGEDRLVKQFIRQNHPQNLLGQLHAITPTQAEKLHNPLSRSAVLRSYKIN